MRRDQVLSDVEQVRRVERTSFDLAVEHLDEFRGFHEIRLHVLPLDSVLRFQMFPEAIRDYVDGVASRAQVEVSLRPMVEEFLHPHFVRS